MSFWTATGSTRSSTKLRTVSWISRCSSVSSKSMRGAYPSRVTATTPAIARKLAAIRDRGSVFTVRLPLERGRYPY